MIWRNKCRILVEVGWGNFLQPEHCRCHCGTPSALSPKGPWLSFQASILLWWDLPSRTMEGPLWCRKSSAGGPFILIKICAMFDTLSFVQLSLPIPMESRRAWRYRGRTALLSLKSLRMLSNFQLHTCISELADFVSRSAQGRVKKDELIEGTQCNWFSLIQFWGKKYILKWDGQIVSHRPSYKLWTFILKTYFYHRYEDLQIPPFPMPSGFKSYFPTFYYSGHWKQFCFS